MVSLCAGLAACVCIAFFGWYQPNYEAYGSLRMSINPDVELTLSRTERVLDAEGLNPDGAALLEGSTSPAWTPAEAAGALVAKSISDGYLSEGGQVTVSVDGGSGRLAARSRRRNAHGARGALRHLRHDPHAGRPRGHHTRTHAKPDADANSDAKSGSDPCANPMPSPPPYTDDDDDWDDDDWDDDWDDDDGGRSGRRLTMTGTIKIKQSGRLSPPALLFFLPLQLRHTLYHVCYQLHRLGVLELITGRPISRSSSFLALPATRPPRWATAGFRPCPRAFRPGRCRLCWPRRAY